MSADRFKAKNFTESPTVWYEKQKSAVRLLQPGIKAALAMEVSTRQASPPSFLSTEFMWKTEVVHALVGKESCVCGSAVISWVCANLLGIPRVNLLLSAPRGISIAAEKKIHPAFITSSACGCFSFCSFDCWHWNPIQLFLWLLQIIPASSCRQEQCWQQNTVLQLYSTFHLSLSEWNKRESSFLVKPNLNIYTAERWEFSKPSCRSRIIHRTSASENFN